MSENVNLYNGLITISDISNEANKLNFIINQILGKVCTTKPVQVLEVEEKEDLNAVGFVTIKPLIMQVDGESNLIEYPPVYNVPYFRIQGGENAIIIDPQVGDIGLAVFSDRDNTVIKSTKQQGAPGSNRRFHLSDAFYIGGFLNGIPKQYIAFQDSGIKVYSPNAISIESPNVNIKSDTAIVQSKTVAINNGDESVSITAPQINVNGAISGGGEGKGAKFSGTLQGDTIKQGEIELGDHKHGGVETGGGTTGTPVP